MDIFLKEGPGSFVTIWMHNEHEKNKKIPSWLSNVWYAFTCFHFLGAFFKSALLKSISMAPLGVVEKQLWKEQQ